MHGKELDGERYFGCNNDYDNFLAIVVLFCNEGFMLIMDTYFRIIVEHAKGPSGRSRGFRGVIPR